MEKYGLLSLNYPFAPFLSGDLDQCFLSTSKSVLQIRRSNRDNLVIISTPPPPTPNKKICCNPSLELSCWISSNNRHVRKFIRFIPFTPSYRISSVIRRVFFLPKQSKRSRSILQDGSRSFGLFRKGKIGIIAKFHRTDLVIWSHSRGTKTPSYSRINTVSEAFIYLLMLFIFYGIYRFSYKQGWFLSQCRKWKQRLLGVVDSHSQPIIGPYWKFIRNNKNIAKFMIFLCKYHRFYIVLYSWFQLDCKITTNTGWIYITLLFNP